MADAGGDPGSSPLSSAPSSPYLPPPTPCQCPRCRRSRQGRIPRECQMCPEARRRQQHFRRFQSSPRSSSASAQSPRPRPAPQPPAPPSPPPPSPPGSPGPAGPPAPSPAGSPVPQPPGPPAPQPQGPPGPPPQITEGYWPELKQVLLADPTGLDRMNIRCPICLIDMDGREVPDPLNMQLGHAANIAPCGHIFGIPCMLELERETNRLDPLLCPLCFYCWDHKVCRHTTLGYPLGRVQQVETVLTHLREPADECVICVLSRSADALTGFARIFYRRELREVRSQLIGVSVSYKGLRWDAPDTSSIPEAPRTLRHLEMVERMGAMVRMCLEQLEIFFRDNRLLVDIEQVRFEVRLYDMTDLYPDENRNGNFTVAGNLWRDEDDP
ncbi:hypothetical protein BKA56DRAFT_608518 [Ilyonectria sp. MPI-CAGE-AT-0026]|nr:hypothetical protein BKA56DRAFT_608518 [Ilyonectria sp. MPI-CAGE-AT-0026]